MSRQRQSLGQKGEDLADTFLRRRGYRILERNYRVPLGEIDLIAEERGTLVFVEVKTRSGHSHGNPAEAITTRKQLQISRVALQYLTDKGFENRPARFDVVAVTLPVTGKARIDLYANAFDLCYGA